MAATVVNWTIFARRGFSLTPSPSAMTDPGNPRQTRPFAWVPTLYFAEGVPFFAISLIAGILYKRMGLGNDVIALYTKLLLLPWSLKPLWSPLLEMFKTKKYFVVLLQLLGGVSLGLVALCLPLPAYFLYTIVLFAVVAFCSSTHDIAADGLYIASLSPKEQAAYAGWQSGFYSVARLFSQGGLIILAGVLEARMDVPHAWMAIFATMGVILMLLEPVSRARAAHRRRRAPFRHCSRDGRHLLGCAADLPQETEYLPAAAIYPSV